MSIPEVHLDTLAVHGGRDPEDDGGLAPSIRPATTFLRGEDGDYPGGHQYSRSSNETRARLESALAALEGGGEAVTFASGMAAASAVFMQLAPGDHAVVSADVYHGVIHFVKQWIVPRGVDVSFCETSDPDALADAIRGNTRLIWFESPSNPEMKITAFAAIAELARARGIVTVCDSTLASPVLQRPLEHGIDAVMHSSTKYLGGHSDMLGGVLVTRNAELARRLRAWQAESGAVPSAFDCWLLLRSLPTLPLRVTRQSASALHIAQWLSEQNGIERVLYPGLASHPGHAVAREQMRAFGGVLSVCVDGSERKARAFASATTLFAQATSLGGVESLIEHRASVEGDNRRSPGNLLRLSVGLEHPDDLLRDLAQALERVRDVN